MILSCCLALGLIFSLFLLKHDYFIGTDGCEYALVGKNLVSGQGYTIWGKPYLWFPPLYPLAIGIFYKFMGNLELAGHAVSIASFLISVIFLFKLARLVYDKSVAFIAVALFIMNENVLLRSYRVETHSLDMLLVISVIYSAVLIIKREILEYRNFILIGIILAAAILNRPESIILSFAVIMIIFLQKKAQISRKMVAFICIILTLAALVFPYANFLHRHTGKWTLTTKITLLKFYEYMGSGDPLARERQIKTGVSEFEPFEYVKQNKKELIIRYLRGVGPFFSKLRFILYGLPGCLLIVLGLLWQGWDKDRRKVQVLLLSSLSPLAIIPLGNLHERYFLFAVPVFLMWMAKGAESLFLPIERYIVFVSAKAKLAICLALVFLASIMPKLLFIKWDAVTTHEHKQMGVWMKNNIKDIEDKKIASRKPWVAFYSGGQNVDIPFKEDYKSILADLKNSGVDYLIIDERLIPMYRPQLKFLLDGENSQDGLIKVHIIRKPMKIILNQLE